MRIRWLLALGVIASTMTATAQTVQLPTFSYFTATTSVMVPDRGSASVAGMSSALDGSISRGLGTLGPTFSTRGFSAVRGASSVSVTATIHDFEAMDAALLGPLANRTAAAVSPEPRLANGPERSGAGSGRQSVAEIQRQQLVEQAQLADEARSYMAQGDEALAKGKPGVAKIYYQMAARRATGELLAEVQAKLRDVTTTKQPSRIAGP